MYTDSSYQKNSVDSVQLASSAGLDLHRFQDMEIWYILKKVVSSVCTDLDPHCFQNMVYFKGPVKQQNSA